ncbi:hypothetical protein SAY86_009060 [Trapa natans]|uniref:RING-CH-type domain-containing protein n=1 Tax=Trapa natans TaxID=22666 RepID=A0AAN7QC14_TRANT|nr:hypothetical protein SAY86_009060 [Trapa natans]
MGDHFVLLVDRLLTESTLRAALESRNYSMQATNSDEGENVDKPSCHKIDFRDLSSSKKIVECRICQDEDEDGNMETPCSCCGSLKYAHRKCVQRWCNEKGNTMCEICHQQFQPGYTAPPPLFQIGRIPMNFRGNWEVYRRESSSNGHHLIAMVSTDRNFTDSDFNDTSASLTRSLVCCRSVALTFMILLILRHALPVMVAGAKEYSLPLLMILLLRSIGIVLPIYIIIRVLTTVHRHRLRQVSSSRSAASSDEEREHLSLPATSV